MAGWTVCLILAVLAFLRCDTDLLMNAEPGKEHGTGGSHWLKDPHYRVKQNGLLFRASSLKSVDMLFNLLVWDFATAQE